MRGYVLGRFRRLVIFSACSLLLSSCQQVKDLIKPCDPDYYGNITVDQDPEGNSHMSGELGVRIGFGGQGCARPDKPSPTPDPNPDPPDPGPIPYPGDKQKKDDAEAIIRTGVIGTIADLRVQFPWVEIYSTRIGLDMVSVKFGGSTDSQTLEYDLQRGVETAFSNGFNVTVTRNYSHDLQIHTYKQ